LLVVTTEEEMEEGEEGELSSLLPVTDTPSLLPLPPPPLPLLLPLPLPLPPPLPPLPPLSVKESAWSFATNALSLLAMTMARRIRILHATRLTIRRVSGKSP
jgi:hypothetical protein